MTKKQYLIIIIIIISINISAQIDLNQCIVKTNEKLNPRVLNFYGNDLLLHANNENTLYYIRKNEKYIFSSINGGVITATVNYNKLILAIASYNASINFYSLFESEKIIHTFKLESIVTSEMVFQKDNLIVGLKNGNIITCDLRTQKIKIINKHNGIVSDLRIINNHLISISNDGTLKISKKNNEQYRLTKEINLKRTLTKIAISPNGQKIAVGCFDGSIIILDENYNTKTILQPHSSIITKLKFKTNTSLISSSFDKKIAQTDINSKETKTLYESNDYISTFDFTKNKFIYSSRKGYIFYKNLLCRE